MLEPGRQYTATGGTGYRYGFNGKELDNDIDGTGVDYDYGMRIYDARIGKFLSVDPLTAKYPWYTPYQFAGNNPIKFIDEDGLEPAEPGTKEHQAEEARDQSAPPSRYIVTKTWYWHAGSKEYNTKAGWYTEERYKKAISPILNDLAGYLGLYNSYVDGKWWGGTNWKPETKKYLNLTSLGGFLGRGFSEDGQTFLLNYAQEYANHLNGSVTGKTDFSPVNVEDFIGLAELAKGGISALAKMSVRNSLSSLKTEGEIFIDELKITTSSTSTKLSRTYTIFQSNGDLFKFGVTDADLIRYNQSLLEAGPGSYGHYTSIVPKYQAHIYEKYLRTLHFNSTGNWFLPGMKIPYPVNFLTGKRLIKP